MLNGRSLLAILLVCLMSGLFAMPLHAKTKEAKRKKAWIAGKVYDTDKMTPIEDLPIRIVNVESGEVTEHKTKDEGCYAFEDVKRGTYSLAVSYKGQDYLLPEKVIVEPLQREVAVAVCVAIPEKDNTLVLLDNCHVCLGAGFPPLGIIFFSGAGAVTGGVLIGRNQEPVVSESRP